MESRSAQCRFHFSLIDTPPATARCAAFAFDLLPRQIARHAMLPRFMRAARAASAVMRAAFYLDAAMQRGTQAQEATRQTIRLREYASAPARLRSERYCHATTARQRRHVDNAQCREHVQVLLPLMARRQPPP